MRIFDFFLFSFLSQGYAQVFLLAGQTQAGKSTFVMEICKPEDKVAVGDGQHSLTLNATLYICGANNELFPREPLFIIDVPGFSATNNIPDEVNKDIIEEFLLYTLNSSIIQGIIYLNDVTGPIAVERGILFLNQIFNENSQKLGQSMVILGTKHDRISNSKFLQTKAQDALSKLAADHQIQGGWMFFNQSWAEGSPSAQDRTENLRNLRQRLKDLKPIQVSKIQEKIELIEQWSEEICANETQIIPYDYNEIQTFRDWVTEPHEVQKAVTIYNQQCAVVNRQSCSLLVFCRWKQKLECVHGTAIINTVEERKREIVLQKNILTKKNVTITPDKMICTMKAKDAFRKMKYMDMKRDTEL